MYVVVIHRVVKKENGSNRNCKMQTTSSFPVEMSSKSGERDRTDFSEYGIKIWLMSTTLARIYYLNS